MEEKTLALLEEVFNTSPSSTSLIHICNIIIMPNVIRCQINEEISVGTHSVTHTHTPKDKYKQV